MPLLPHILPHPIWALVVSAICVYAPASEEQAHGLLFEHWVSDTFFSSYRPDEYTQKWDIPAKANRLSDPALTSLPANPKSTKWGTPVGLGDALRQFDINEPFLLILGYWEQSTPTEKKFVKLLAPRIEPPTWRALWAPLTRHDLERLDALIKDRTLSETEVRQRVHAMKRRPPFSQAIIVLNPKIDAHGQRRLQCSVRYADVFMYLAPGVTPDREASPLLWGVPYPGPFESAERTFHTE
jgi:hypothetical protein